MSHLRLHDYDASANCLKVRILLGLLGLDYERVPVDIFAGETLTDAFAALNPLRETPVLEVDGSPLCESASILWFLAEGTAYLPGDPRGRAEVVRWLLFEQLELIPAVAGLRFRLMTGRYDEAHPEVAARRARAALRLPIVEAALSGSAWLVGDRASIADIACYGYLHRAEDAGIPLAAYPAIERWIGRVEALPGFRNDLVPYPENARPGAGRSTYDG